MSMGINLIPSGRRLRRRRRARMRLWGIVGGACVAVAGAGAGWLRMDLSGGRVDPSTELESLAREAEQITRQTNARRLELARAEATLRTNRAVGDQPDWSILLDALARRLGESVVLSSCTLGPAGPSVRLASAEGPAPVATGPKPGEYVLGLGGLARTQEAVSRYVLELEKTGLFQRVTLIETQRAEFRGAGAVSFRVECAMSESKGASK